MSGAHRYVMVRFAALVSTYRPNHFEESEINRSQSVSRSSYRQMIKILKTPYSAILLYQGQFLIFATGTVWLCMLLVQDMNITLCNGIQRHNSSFIVELPCEVWRPPSGWRGHVISLEMIPNIYTGSIFMAALTNVKKAKTLVFLDVMWHRVRKASGDCVMTYLDANVKNISEYFVTLQLENGSESKLESKLNKLRIFCRSQGHLFTV